MVRNHGDGGGSPVARTSAARRKSGRDTPGSAQLNDGRAPNPRRGDRLATGRVRGIRVLQLQHGPIGFHGRRTRRVGLRRIWGSCGSCDPCGAVLGATREWRRREPASAGYFQHIVLQAKGMAVDSRIFGCRGSGSAKDLGGAPGNGGTPRRERRRANRVATSCSWENIRLLHAQHHLHAPRSPGQCKAVSTRRPPSDDL